MSGAEPTIVSEVVWDDAASNGGATGGGVSTVFPVPAWQQSAGVPVSANPGGTAGRGVPDVAGDADPETGYAIRVDGGATVVGGTSAVAPLWAGLVALMNQKLGHRAGLMNALLYANPAALQEITTGNNEVGTAQLGYAAGPGWNACSGLGRPIGSKVLAVLQG